MALGPTSNSNTSMPLPVQGLQQHRQWQDAVPIVADPADTELNQAYLSYGGFYDTDMKLGRQRIILDNARFVGNSGWRQNEQTFDAFSLQNKSLPNTVITYAYLDRVHNITFDEIKLSAHLFNMAYDLAPWAKLIGYGYLLDYDLDTGPTKDTQTLWIARPGRDARRPRQAAVYPGVRPTGGISGFRTHGGCRLLSRSKREQ